LNHANKRKTTFVVLVGEEEMKTNSYTLKDMSSGEQFKEPIEELSTSIK